MSHDPPRPDDSTVVDLFMEHAQRAPTAPAILGIGAATLAYGTFAQQLDELGQTLAGVGVGRHDRVAILLPNGPVMATTVLGVMTNAAAAPLNPLYTADELRFYLTDLAPSLLLVGATLDTPARDIAASLGVPVLEVSVDGCAHSNAATGSTTLEPHRPDDLALLLHTSGTTSRPKLVPLTQRNLAASARHVAATLELASDDRCFNLMPLFHIHGIVAALLASLASGGSIVCTEGFDTDAVISSMHALEPTWYTAVPTIHRAMLDALARDDAPAPPLRFLRSSSAALPTTTFTELEAAFDAPVIEAYGMTEAAHQMASNPRTGARKPGCVGPAAGPELAILHDGAVTQVAGVVGEIVIRGPNVMTGYVDNPDANASAFVDGWFRTGDQGTLDDDGYLTITGRLKEIVNRGGEKVAPTEVEEALLAHPEVAQAVAFAISHPRLGEDVAAAVVLAEGSTASRATLRRFVAERLAPFKVPNRIVFIADIPKGATGKVQRIGMAERLGLEQHAAEERAVVEPRDGTERELARIFADVLQLDAPVSVTDDFVELGADSLHFEELLSEIERVFHQSLPASVFIGDATPERIAALLRTPVDDESREPVIVPIHEFGTRPPLFCVMRAGTLVTARHFVTELGDDQPVYGIWMPGMHGADDEGGSVEEIAAACRRVVHDVQPTGPYFLFGYSIGGLVAYEMARQYATAGEEAALVVMADTPYPVPLPTARDRVAKLFSREGPPAIARRLQVLAQRVPAVRTVVKPAPPGDLAQRAEMFRAVGVDFDATLRRERAYVSSPRPPAAPIALLRCRHTVDVVCAGSEVIGWEAYVQDDWQVLEVPGSHDSMLGEPHVHALAATLGTCLREAQQRASARR